MPEPLVRPTRAASRCPFCGESGGRTVARAGTLGAPLLTVCCESCTTLRVLDAGGARQRMSEVPSEEIAHLRRGGGLVLPGEPGSDVAMAARYLNQAQIARTLGDLAPACEVLDLGCGAGETLRLLSLRDDVVPTGIEARRGLARRARERGVRCHEGSLRDLPQQWGPFRLACGFRVLERVASPLQWLFEVRQRLQPDGRLVLVTANAYQPYGLLEGDFFRREQRTTFSPRTLPAFCRRAGFDVMRVVDGPLLFVVARPRVRTIHVADPGAEGGSAAEDADWVSQRFATYRQMEALRQAAWRHGPTPALVRDLMLVLRQPGFVPHTIDAVRTLVTSFMAHGNNKAAYALASTAAMGPYPKVVQDGFLRLADAVAGVGTAVA